ncbi:transcription factor MYB60 [Eucalyptus grandis]|uniref:Uncharacterized protein n=2 Tax=Eucalyptus grandis TaxID=71139 RepID=A0ACC3IU50_EUCGR|nr:transcription factor MYB60 [Eucalyptus grandis]KAK3405289.1 hypothetical protein EUGRSUZ_K01545 [Eucalyptus grandis]
MGRPPCCDQVGIKKGPWTPEEDIILVSYIQEHGPGNWRSVPTNTGLLRCSKSCRLRWTNYLRPGIKRGNFTPHEEGMIIHLQALLGNKWAAIASYLPQRTDNDIKNYWNTHLKKKLKKLQSPSSSSAMDPHNMASSDTTTPSRSIDESHHQRRASSCLDLIATSSPSSSSSTLNKLSHTSTYASSTENISRLLEGWMRSSPKTNGNTENDRPKFLDGKGFAGHENNGGGGGGGGICYRPKAEHQEPGDPLISHDEFESILSFENMNNKCNVSWDKSNGNSTHHPHHHKGDCSDDRPSDANEDEKVHGMMMLERNYNKAKPSEHAPPLTFLEKWLLDETASGQVEDMMDLPSMF